MRLLRESAMYGNGRSGEMPGPPDEVCPENFYRELRGIAQVYLNWESAGHTLQPTALVHEVFLRMCGPDNGSLSAADYLARATRCMRRVLIDHARRKKAVKRVRRIEDRSEVCEERSVLDLLAVDEALRRLEALDERAAQLVRLRFFAGLTVREAARVMNIGLATAEDDWRIARAWLARWLGSSEVAGDGLR